MKLYHRELLTLQKDGTTLDCLRFGTGARALVIIPGLSFQRVRSAGLTLAWMYRIFAKEYTVYIMDKKEVLPEDCTIQAMAEDAAHVMTRLGIGPADVLGVSQGGMIAQYLAIGYPHLVRRLALGVTASRVNPVMEDVIRRWVELARQDAYGAIVADMLPRMYSAAYIRRYGWMLPLLSRVGKPKDMRRFTAMAMACLTCDAYPRLDNITCPVLVLGGRQDRIVTGRASEEIAEKLKCQIYMYDALGHSAYEEAKDFNRRVYRFFSE